MPRRLSVGLAGVATGVPIPTLVHLLFNFAAQVHVYLDSPTCPNETSSQEILSPLPPAASFTLEVLLVRRSAMDGVDSIRLW